MVTVDDARIIHIDAMDALGEDGEHSAAETSMAAHGDSVLGICPLKSPNKLNAEFYTWSSNSTVNFWDTKGKCQDSRVVPLEQPQAGADDVPNELKILRATSNMEYFVSGDRLGVLR
jgi:hypothetical protein